MDELSVGVIGPHGFVRGIWEGEIWKPCIPFEWATFPLNYPSFSPDEQIFVSDEGQVGLSCKSNQNPFPADPAAWLSVIILLGLVI